jgi:hypothetical protein
MSNTGNSSSWDGLSICETHHFAARPMAVRQPPPSRDGYRCALPILRADLLLQPPRER